MPDTYPDAAQRMQRAKQCHLYHAHIGLPYWENKGYGYLTSNQVIHFRKMDTTTITLLSISTHNPMDLPDIDLIQES